MHTAAVGSCSGHVFCVRCGFRAAFSLGDSYNETRNQLDAGVVYKTDTLCQRAFLLLPLLVYSAPSFAFSLNNPIHFIVPDAAAPVSPLCSYFATSSLALPLPSPYLSPPCCWYGSVTLHLCVSLFLTAFFFFCYVIKQRQMSIFPKTHTPLLSELMGKRHPPLLCYLSRT